VTAFMAAVYDPHTEEFDYKKWHTKPITLEAVADMLPVWKANNASPEPLPHIDYGGGGYAGQVAYVRAWYASEEGKAKVREELEARGQYDAANS